MAVEASGFVGGCGSREDHRSQLGFATAGSSSVTFARSRPPRAGGDAFGHGARDDVDVHCERQGARRRFWTTDFEYGERQHAAEDSAATTDVLRDDADAAPRPGAVQVTGDSPG